MPPEKQKQAILIVDDEPDNIRVLSNLLQQDYSPLAASNGQDALETAFSATPDLILLDILMPGMSGYEVCVRLKADPKTRDIPIIFITALEQADDETKGFESGAVDYITKPFSPTVVAARVRTHLELKKHRDKLKKKIRGLKKTMDISVKHTDAVTVELEGKVEASIREIEERVRLISETIPVPVIISRMSDGTILYTNEHASRALNFSVEELLEMKAAGLFENKKDNRAFRNCLDEEGRVDNFEIRLMKKDNTAFWAALFSQPMEFKNQSCALTVIYDLSEQKRKDEEIRRLNEELERSREREEKYLIFSLAKAEYGLSISKVREIIRNHPLRPIPNGPDDLKGVMNLRDNIIPVYDLRRTLGLRPCEPTNRTSIIILDFDNDEGLKFIGLIVDTVVEVLGIKRKFIDAPPVFGRGVDVRFISSIAKTDRGIKILLNLNVLFSDIDESVPDINGAVSFVN